MNDLLLLSTILAGPQHGYALKKRIGLMTGHGEMHNNLVYPLLKGFVAQGWVSCRTVPGQRGQTRERYALTAKGRKELLRRLREFSRKDAASDDAFHLRVGLFAVLDAEARERILAGREEWLEQRGNILANLAAAMDLGEWGGEVVAYRRSQIRAERQWTAQLRRKALRRGNRKQVEP
ncbi:MAG TPA: PadR family transcriptional regulator [Candidatus Acidoferrum sp.]|jgi:DNA-binding PadR family transcriptional regulator